MELSIRAAMDSDDRSDEPMTDGGSSADGTGGASSSTAFLLARLLFGGVLAFMAIDGFKRNEGRVESARSNGVPNPDLLVPLATGSLLAGSLGILTWRLPRLAAIGVATFFVGVTPVQHAFWSEEPENRRGQQISFLKNSAMLGGAILFFERAQRDQE